MSETNRPKPGPEPPATEGEFTAVDFDKMLADRKGQIRDRLERLGVLGDLAAAKCDRLTDIVLDLAAGYSWPQQYPYAEKWLRVDRKVGRRQREKFTGKVRDALASVDAALDYVAKIGSGDRRNELLSRNLKGLATPHLNDAKAALQNILHDFEYFTSPAKEKSTPGSESMFAEKRADVRGVLQDFFVKDCDLTESKASQRTARIGNHFKWWRVDERDQHESANPDRARAITRSVARRAKKRR